MASNTENLNLLMKNPSTDGADTFNIQTMLNENWQKIDNNAGTVAQTLANILKPTTPPLIGLPPSTTPDGMFQALGNTGELHVWRKIVTTAQEIPAGYTLENATNQKLAVKGDGGTAGYSLYVYYCSTISVDNNGTVHPGTETSIEFVSSANMDRLNDCKGKFIRMGSGKYSSYTEGEFFIPSDAVFSFTNHVLTVNKCQKVNPYPLTPAGTTTTYPVSTNPNAYQEGEYGKAGYTLGDVKTGTFQIGQGATTIAANRDIVKYGASVSVTDTGTASIASESELTVTSDSSQSAVDKLKGKFFRFSQLPFSSSAFSVGKIYFFPANTVFTKQSSGNWYASKYQTVTSHGKTEPEYTIEYLGKLGDKARVQVVSYVGTGTYGADNPCSITADFKIKLAMMLGYFATGYGLINMLAGSSATNILIASVIGTEYKQHDGFTVDRYNYPAYGKISKDQKTFSWYGTDSSGDYYNSSGYPYYILVIG